MELAGLQLAINRIRVDAILKATKDCLPELCCDDVLETWAGLRPVCSDGLPIIGRSRKYENLLLATGHGMLGLTQATVTGRLIRDLVKGDEPPIPLAAIEGWGHELLLVRAHHRESAHEGGWCFQRFSRFRNWAGGGHL